MARRVCMWIALGSLISLALFDALASLATTLGAVWIFDTPYSNPPAPPTLAMRAYMASQRAQLVLFPLACLSSACYILLLDRDMRRSAAQRGFEVEVRPQAAGG